MGSDSTIGIRARHQAECDKQGVTNFLTTNIGQILRY